MSADFWAGYISGAIGIIIGNPLDLIKVRLQASGPAETSVSPRQLARFDSVTSLVRGRLAVV
jgi:solute carrier family 25 carnitine/acylcarnitine transporter 20/29